MLTPTCRAAWVHSNSMVAQVTSVAPEPVIATSDAGPLQPLQGGKLLEGLFAQVVLVIFNSPPSTAVNAPSNIRPNTVLQPI